MIVPLQEIHIPAVGQIHCEALPQDFLPSLGEAFLQTLYHGVLKLQVGFGWVSQDGNTITGFILGCADSGAMFKKLSLRWGPALTLALVPSLIRRPLLLKNVLETFLYPRREGRGVPRAELVVIAVKEGYRSRGIGKDLVAHLEQSFAQRGIARYKVTVDAGNEGANRFYARCGFRFAYTFGQYGRSWNLYTRSVPSTSLTLSPTAVPGTKEG